MNTMNTGHQPGLGRDGGLSTGSPRLVVSAANVHSPRHRRGINVNTYIVRRHGDAFVVGVFEGNYEDPRTVVATALAAERVREQLEPKDGPEALVAALELANGVVRELAEGSLDYGTALIEGLGLDEQWRTNFIGIGVSCALAIVTPDQAWIASVGECSVWQLDPAGPRELLGPQPRTHALGFEHEHDQAPGALELRAPRSTTLDAPLVLVSASVHDVIARRRLDSGRIDEICRALIVRVSPEEVDRTCVVVGRRMV